MAAATSKHHNSAISPLEHPSRPALQSHLSSSVPTSPTHKPQDRRYISRSPSPRRGLGSHSPQSVVSEAIGTTVRNGAPRPMLATPVVCKFETAPEFRKRRVPYIEDGDKELAPPEKKPKAALEPHEEDKLSGDMRELYDRLLPSAESEQRRAALVKKLERIFDEEWPGNDIKVSVFGSSGNLLSSSDSDVDICITTTLKKVESMHTLATLLDRHGMERVVCRAAAKVPIVKCWDPALQLACDVNVNNPLALENTRMIKTYVQLDPRVRPLAKVIKHWTKQRILNDAAFGGTISSYTWICMIISFLQLRKPPVLPSLQRTPGHRSVIDGHKSAFADDLDALKTFGEANKESMATLLFHFFRYYSYEFEYSKYVISVKEGKETTRKEKGWDNYRENKEARCRLCVEEPFNTSRNLGNSADDYAWSGIHGEIRRAFELLADGAQLEKCCEQYEFPPEEKSIFVRPEPRPKPTLTRSASQSGSRTHLENGQPRSRKNSNRTQSSQRSSNRRASSGAVFGNQRVPLLHSPQLGVSAIDYFAKQGNLHDHLIQQFQYLQAQRDVLTSQLVMREQQQQQQQQQQHAHVQGQSQPQSGNASPRMRSHGFAGGRTLDAAPQTAPLLPGSLYHFTARYPPTSPALSQQMSRSNDGSVTNPSSPSLANAIPAQFRQGNRNVMPDGSKSSVRSQSQPGRSLPHPITLQQQVHPGYDVSGALGGVYQNARASQYVPHALATAGYSFFPPMPYSAGLPSIDPAMPREYVGYYVGQSPQLAPQYATANQIPVSAVPILSSPPQTRQRRDTSDLMPPLDRRNSRSPSPLGNVRSPTTAVVNPASIEPANIPPLDPGEPIIVNGSTPYASRSQERSNGSLSSTSSRLNGENALGLDIPSAAQHLPIRPIQEDKADTSTPTEQEPSVAASSLKSSSRNSPHLTLSPSGTPPNGHDRTALDTNHTAIVPLLSPVAELRTPSPTLSNRADIRDWPKTNGIDHISKGTGANTSDDKRSLPSPKSKHPATPTEAKQLRESTQTQGDNASVRAEPRPIPPVPLSAGISLQEKNPWQQATGKKGHKKKNSIAYATAAASNIPRSPVIEGERKGG